MKYQIQFFARKDNEWVRAYIDDRGRLWAIFGDSLEDVSSLDAEFMDITSSVEWLEGFTIVKIEVY
jgi:hypothetical protein